MRLRSSAEIMDILKAEHDALKKRLKGLETAMGALTDDVQKAVKKSVKKGKKSMSAAAKKKISAAKKAWWAAKKKAKKPG